MLYSSKATSAVIPERSEESRGGKSEKLDIPVGAMNDDRACKVVFFNCVPFVLRAAVINVAKLYAIGKSVHLK